MKTILLIMALAMSAFAQGIQPQYPDGATMTAEQFELNFCYAQHWSSKLKPHGISIHFIGRWTDDQKVEFGERCMKFVRAGGLAFNDSAIAPASTLTSPPWQIRAWINGLPSVEVSK